MNKEELKKSFLINMTLRVNILRNISIDYNYAKFLFSNPTPIDLNKHWSHIRHNFFKILIIDIAKLFVDNDNQKLNFFKFLTRLEKGDYKNLGVSIQRINYFRAELNKHKIFFEVVGNYRNKLFAHTEIQAGIGPHTTFFPKLEDLINIGFEICNETSKTVSNREIVNSINLTDLTTFKLC